MHRTLLAVLLFGCLLAAGCARPLADPSTVVVLADTTASAKATKERMLADFNRVLDSISVNTHLAVMNIEANSLVSPVQMAITPTLAEVKPLFGQYNQYTLRRELRKARDGARSDFAAMLEAPVKARPGSALIDAIVRSEKLLERADGQKTLVVLSDGYEQGAEMDFTQLRAEAIAPLIEQLRSAGRVPDLKGACVYFAGITEGAPPLPGETVRAVGQFWESYFRAANAKLVWYDASLVNFAPNQCET